MTGPRALFVLDVVLMILDLSIRSVARSSPLGPPLVCDCTYAFTAQFFESLGETWLVLVLLMILIVDAAPTLLRADPLVDHPFRQTDMILTGETFATIDFLIPRLALLTATPFAPVV